MKREQGFVSLFSVIFFMMMITVITIGFLRIMGVEQRQSVDNDLSASALVSAEAGLEDGKRAIIKYNSLSAGDPNKTAWSDALSSPVCNALLKNTTTKNALQLQPVNPSNPTDVLIGQPTLNQAYTCLTVNLNSPDYISHSTAGKSEFIPIRYEAGKSFDQVKIYWHLLSTAVGSDGDGVPGSYAPIQSLPPVTGNGGANWTDNRYPAYLRVQIYGVPNNRPFTRSDIDDRTHTVYLAPNDSGVNENTPIFMDQVDPRGLDQAKVGVQGIACKPINFANPGSAPLGSYACAATLVLSGDPNLRNSNNSYFARVTPLYGATHFKLELRNSIDNSVVNFNGVQPIIDSTGRAKDVFRRVQARVRSDQTSDLPEYVVESVNDICKDMMITDNNTNGYSVNNCPILP
jgi:hypothetical protein